MSFISNLMNKISAVILILSSLILLVFFSAYFLAPEATNAFFMSLVESLPSGSEKIVGLLSLDLSEVSNLVNELTGDVNITLGNGQVLDVRIIICVIAALLLGLLMRLKLLSVIAKFVFNLSAGISAIYVIETFETYVSHGMSYKEAANTMGWLLFGMAFALSLEIMLQLFELFIEDKKPLGAMQSIAYPMMFLFLALVVALVVTGISWLILGLGLSGILFAMYAIVCIIGIVLEGKSLFGRSYEAAES